MKVLMKQAYKNWKLSRLKIFTSHPDEETLACFVEGKLSLDEVKSIKAHLLFCGSCSELISMNLEINCGMRNWFDNLFRLARSFVFRLTLIPRLDYIFKSAKISI